MPTSTVQRIFSRPEAKNNFHPSPGGRLHFLSRQNRRKGFTFLEIMLVVAIIGILLAIVGPKLSGQTARTRVEFTRLQMRNIEQALGQYEMRLGDYPTTEQGVLALVRRPSDVSEDDWDQFLEQVPRDAWKREFLYRCPGEHGNSYDLISLGKDGREDTADDIANSPKAAVSKTP